MTAVFRDVANSMPLLDVSRALMEDLFNHKAHLRLSLGKFGDEKEGRTFL